MDSLVSSMTTQRGTRTRFLVVFMLFITVVINYLDRANMAVAAPALRQSFGLDPHQLGFVLSAFGWSYVLFQIPGGLLVDRVSPRIFYPILIALWSLTTLLVGFSLGITVLFALRMLVGAFKSPSYPMNNRIVTFWMPERERASAISFYTSGQYVGLAFLTPVLMVTESHFGWRGIFVLTGLIGLVWAAAWYAFYRDPRQSKRVNEAELAYIRAHGGLADTGARHAPASIGLSDFGVVLGSRKLWGLYIGQFALTSTQWFFLTWFPTYLVHYRHMDFIKAGFYGSLPFIAAFCGVLCGGFFSDFLLRSGLSLGTARRTPIIAGFLLSTCIVGANYVELDRAGDFLPYFGLLRQRLCLADLVAGLRHGAAPPDWPDRWRFQHLRQSARDHRATGDRLPDPWRGFRAGLALYRHGRRDWCGFLYFPGRESAAGWR